MPLLVQRLAQVLAGRPERLALDMAGATFIGCASARLIAGTGRHPPDGVRPVIRSPGLVARRILELTGLAGHLEPGAPAPGCRRARGPAVRCALPGAPFQAWFGQCGWLEKRGRRAEIERAER